MYLVIFCIFVLTNLIRMQKKLITNTGVIRDRRERRGWKRPWEQEVKILVLEGESYFVGLRPI